MRLRRRIIVFGVAAIVNGLLFRRRNTFSSSYTFPVVGYVIGFLAGVFVDRGVRESSISDNVLVGRLLGGIAGLYDYVNGITNWLYTHPYGLRLTITVLVLGCIGIVSALVNELRTGKPGKIGTIAITASVLALVVFAFSTQTITVVEHPNAVYDTGKIRVGFVLVNTTTGEPISYPVVANNVFGTNGTVTGSASVVEDTGTEAYVKYTYITIRDDDVGLRGGKYHFEVSITGIDDGVVHNDYYENGSVIVRLSVIDIDTYTIYRRDTVYDGPISYNTTLNVEFNATIGYDVAAIVNAKNTTWLRLEIGFYDAGLNTTKRDKLSVTVTYYLVEVGEPNSSYVYLAIALLTLAVIDAVPEFGTVRIRRRRRRTKSRR